MVFFLAQKKIDPRIKLFIAGKGDQKYTNYLRENSKKKKFTK